MNQLYEVRKAHGDTFVTVFNDGLLVPWKTLSIGDYIKYSKDKNRGAVPSSHLEDEIFKKCVLDDSIIRQFEYLNAGIVSTVVINIWQFSGPTGVSEFNNDLQVARQMMDAPDVRALHELVQVISIAFPYKPEEIYEMDYQTFLFRLAQSERKLIQMGIYLKEPISLQPAEEEKPQKRNKLGKITQPDEQERPKVDVRKLWEEQQSPKKPPPPKLKPDEVKTTGEKWWKKSPVLEAPNRKNIDFASEAAEDYHLALTGHEKADIHIEAAKMVEDAQWIYADLIKELNNRKK